MVEYYTVIPISTVKYMDVMLIMTLVGIEIEENKRKTTLDLRVCMYDCERGGTASTKGGNSLKGMVGKVK